MVFLQYSINNKQVIEIHSTEPMIVDGYDFAVSNDKELVDNNGDMIFSNDFKVGDEFEWTIWVNEVDENKNLLSYSAIRNNPNAQRLLKENDQLKQENILLKAQNQALTERADFIEDVVAEMAVQVYQ